MAKKKKELTETERDAIESQIRTLTSKLDAPTSNIGDWKSSRFTKRDLTAKATRIITRN